MVVSLFGVLFGLLSGSLSIMFDGVFAAIDAAMSGLALFVSRLVTRESNNRRFQFGYWHIEPMVLAFNGGTLMLLCFYAFLNAVDSLLAGGRQLDFDWAIAYAVIVCRRVLRHVSSTSSRANRRIALGLRAARRAELADVGGHHLGAAGRLRHRLVARTARAYGDYLTPYADPRRAGRADALPGVRADPHRAQGAAARSC